MKRLVLFFLFGAVLAFSLIHCSGGGSPDSPSSEGTEESSDSGSSAPEPQNDVPVVEESDAVPAVEEESEEDLSGQSEQGDQALEEEVSELPEEAADESSATPEGDTETAEATGAADIETKTVAEAEAEEAEEEESADAEMTEEEDVDAATDDEDSEDSDTLSDDDFAEGEESSVSSVSVDADDLAQSLGDEEETQEPSSQSCSPGDTSACYSGPEGTAGVGVCKAGFSSCSDTGTVGECVFSVTPQTEDCLTSDDEDCNGVAEGCEALCPAEQTIDLALGDAKTVSASTVGNPDQYTGSCGGAGTSDTVIAFRTKEQGTLKITVTPEPSATFTPILYLSEGCSDAAELCKTGNTLAVKTDPYEVTHRLFIDGGQGKFSVVATVSPEACGDGAQNYGEQCDDGNTASGDGCSACLLDCGNGKIENAEECDDGNEDPIDGCDQCKSISYYVEDYKNFCSVPDPNEIANENNQAKKTSKESQPNTGGYGNQWEDLLDWATDNDLPSPYVDGLEDPGGAKGYGIQMVVNGHTLEIHVRYELIYADITTVDPTLDERCDGDMPTQSEIQHDIETITKGIEENWENESFEFCGDTYKVDIIFDDIVVRDINAPPHAHYNQMYLYFCQLPYVNEDEKQSPMKSNSAIPVPPFSGEYIPATSMAWNMQYLAYKGGNSWNYGLGHEFGHSLGFTHDQKVNSDYANGVLMGSGNHRKTEYLVQLLTRNFKACKIEFDTDLFVYVQEENDPVEGGRYSGTYRIDNIGTSEIYVANLVEWNEFHVNGVYNWEFISDKLTTMSTLSFDDPPQEPMWARSEPIPAGKLEAICDAYVPPDPDRDGDIDNPPINHCAWEMGGGYPDHTTGNTVTYEAAAQDLPNDDRYVMLYPTADLNSVHLGFCPIWDLPFSVVGRNVEGGVVVFFNGIEADQAMAEDLLSSSGICVDPGYDIRIDCKAGDCQGSYVFSGSDAVKTIKFVFTGKGSLVPFEELTAQAK